MQAGGKHPAVSRPGGPVRPGPRCEPALPRHLASFPARVLNGRLSLDEDHPVDQLAALRLFVQIARLRSISAAARALGLSTTAASRRLQDLEAALATRLVDRTTRQLALTEPGQRLFARAVDALGTLDAAFTEARELGHVPMGTLRIVARRSFGMIHVAPALPGFRAAYPLIDLELTLTEQLGLMPGHGVDLVIRMGAPTDKSVVAHKLTSPSRKLCASPGYYARAGMPRAPADLGGHACLAYRRAAEPALWTFHDAAGQVSVTPVHGPLQSNSGDVLRAAAAAGMGLALLPDWMVMRDLQSGALQTCLDDYTAYAPPYREPIFAVHRRGDVPAKVTVFVAHLRQALAMPLSRPAGN